MAILIDLNDARKKLNELEGSAEYNKGITDAFNALFDLPTIEAVPTDFHDMCMQMEIEKRIALQEFILWVTDWIFKDDFEESAGAFAELACRRLEKLGYVYKEDNKWLSVDFKELDDEVEE